MKRDFTSIIMLSMLIYMETLCLSAVIYIGIRYFWPMLLMFPPLFVLVIVMLRDLKNEIWPK